MAIFEIQPDGFKKVEETSFCTAGIQERAALLTPAQRTVMNLVVQGKPNKLIAKQLNMSTRTIESRRHEVFAKMGVESVAELVRLAIEGELVA